MKHPDRRRKRARSERLEPLPPPASGPITPSPLPSELTGGASPPAGAPSPAPAPAPAAPAHRAVRVRLFGLVGVVAVCGLAGLAASRKTPTVPTSATLAPTHPTTPPTAQSSKPWPSPLATLEPLPAQPSPTAPQVSKPRPVEKVAPEKRVSGNGYPLLVDALTKVPAASVTASHEMSRAVSTPGTPLGAEGMKFARAAWPAIQELEQAARSETFAAVGSDTLDFGKLDTVTSAALAIAHMESATRVPLGREVVHMIRVGHALAGSGALLDSAVGIAQARKAEKWLKTSLESDPWNVEELAWIAGELDGLRGPRASLTPENIAFTGSAELVEKRRAGLTKSFDIEKHELDKLSKFAHEKAAAAGRKGT